MENLKKGTFDKLQAFKSVNFTLKLFYNMLNISLFL